jgi:hypothetical protein
LDNLVYTLWLNANGKVSDAFVEKTISLVRESLVFYDILFFLPITKFSPVNFMPKENRSNSLEYRSEIDNIFKSLVNQYNQSNKVFFPFDHTKGCPAIIEIYGNPAERIELTKFYISASGGQYEEKDSLMTASAEELAAKQLLESACSPIQARSRSIIPVTKKDV